MELVLGGGLFLLTIIVLADSIARRRGRGVIRGPRLTVPARRALMIVLSTIALAVALPALIPALRRGAFAFCSVCPVSPSAVVGVSSLPDFLRVALLGSTYYAATVLPVFVLACLLSGLLSVRTGRFPIRGLWRSFGLAAILPVCSCGTVPLGKTMIESGGTGPRDGVVFLATAPLLSPVIIVLAVTVLGPVYAIARVAASAVVAVAAAYCVTPFLDPAAGRRPPAACPSCDAPPAQNGAVVAGWEFLSRLFRYALYGIVLGALFAAALPPEYVATIIRPGALATAAAVVVGLPINMCSGEEVLLTAPLVGMGLTLGHALAFALASTGICLGSIPLLTAALGKKAVVTLVAVYLAVPFLLGLLVDALPIAGSFGPKPF